MSTKEKECDSSIFEDLSLLYEYPKEELIPVISLLIKKFSKKSNLLFIPIIDKLNTFFDYCSSNPLSKLEEDYIATFEMNTKYVLYVGHKLFGENYERSEFIAQLKEYYTENNFIIENNELPDHIAVILNFLSKDTIPSEDKNKLVENLIQSFGKETNFQGKVQDTFLTNIDVNNKYPLLYLLLTDLIEIFKIWEID